MLSIESLEKSLLEKEIQAQIASCEGDHVEYLCLESEISAIKNLLIQKISKNNKVVN